jgi:hypothetical protein
VIFCSKEIKGLASTQYTGYNLCEVLDIMSECHYKGLHNPGGELQIVWQAREGDKKNSDYVPVGAIVMENRDGGISVITESEYKKEYMGCC